MGKDTLLKILSQQSHDSLATKVCMKDLNLQDYIVIDMRKKLLYELNHIKGSINIEDLEQIKRISKENQTKKILLYCSSGLESAKYGNSLVEDGCKNIYFLDEYIQVIQNHLPMENKN